MEAWRPRQALRRAPGHWLQQESEQRLGRSWCIPPGFGPGPGSSACNATIPYRYEIISWAIMSNSPSAVTERLQSANGKCRRQLGLLVCSKARQLPLRPGPVLPIGMAGRVSCGFTWRRVSGARRQHTGSGLHCLGHDCPRAACGRALRPALRQVAARRGGRTVRHAPSARQSCPPPPRGPAQAHRCGTRAAPWTGGAPPRCW